MRTVLQDLRFGWSMLVRKRAITSVMLVALVLGIGANTAIFSVVNSILLRPLPYDDADRLVRLYDAKPPELEHFPVSPGNFTYWRDRTRSFEHVAAYYGGPPIVLTGLGPAEQLDAMRVSANVFSLLRVDPLLGRTFGRKEERWENDRVVVISHGMWQRRFGGDRAVIGRTLTLSDRVHTIIGVMPASFEFPAATTEAWLPLGFTPKDVTKHGSHFLTVLARMRKSASVEQARTEMSVVAATLARQFPESNGAWRTEVTSWQDDLTGPMRAPLLILSCAVAFVLLIACVNVANLLLVRATARSREMAIRAALGASRSRIVRQLLTESVLLSLIGGAVGLLLAIGGIAAIAMIAATAVPGIGQADVDLRVLAFTLIVSIVSGVLFGLAPAIQASSPDLNRGLKEGMRGTSAGGWQTRIRKMLVVAEISIALVLLVGSGLLIKSFVKLRDVDPGFDTANVLTMNIALPKIRYPKEQQPAFFQRVTERVAALPGVRAASVATPLPFTGDLNYGFAIDGMSTADDGKLPIANYSIVGPGYFRAMGVTLLAGRAFTGADRKDAPRVAIISETLARKYFANVSPIGKRVYLTDGKDAWREVVGVARDVRQYGLDTEPKPHVYDCALQVPWLSMSLVVRTATKPEVLTQPIVAAVHAIDDDQPVTNIQTMEDIVGTSMARRRFSMTLLTLFAAVALLLATTGIYAVMSYSVAQRTQEIGIRMSLGAQQADILQLVVGQTTGLVLTGVALGLTGSLALTRAMRSLLFGVSTTDVPVFAGVAVLMTIVALAASYIPARKAARVDPLVALRQE